MVRPISDANRAKLYAESDGDVVFTLLTIVSSEFDTLRFCNNPTDSLGEGTYKTTSNGNDFVYLPFEAQFPHDTNGLPRAQLVLTNIGREMIQPIRSIQVSPNLTIEAVFASDPDSPIVTASNLRFSQVKYNAAEVVIDLVGIRLDEEPFPSSVFSPTITPGVFGS